MEKTRITKLVNESVTISSPKESIEIPDSGLILEKDRAKEFSKSIETLNTLGKIQVEDMETSKVMVVREGQTVQQVLDSITNASETNKYLVLVPPGHELEYFNNTNKNIGINFLSYSGNLQKSIFEKEVLSSVGIHPMTSYSYLRTGSRFYGPIWTPFSEDITVTSTDWTTLYTCYLYGIFYPQIPILFMLVKMFNDSHGSNIITKARIIIGSDNDTDVEVLLVEESEHNANPKFRYNETVLLDRFTAAHNRPIYLKFQAQVTGSSTGTIFKESCFGLIYEV